MQRAEIVELLRSAGSGLSG